jgi:transcriptional regulator with XRE-family HTH domain
MPTTAADRSAAGEALRAARESAGVTRSKLATLADVSVSTLALIETGCVPRRSVALTKAWTALTAFQSSEDEDS